MSKSLAKAIDRRKKAEDNVEAVLKRDYPVDGEITWRRNGLFTGFVVMHGSGGRIKVENQRTGKILWIYAYTIVDAMEK